MGIFQKGFGNIGSFGRKVNIAGSWLRKGGQIGTGLSQALAPVGIIAPEAAPLIGGLAAGGAALSGIGSGLQTVGSALQ